MKLWLFLVEGNSDKIYVDKIIKYYVKSEKLKKEIKLEWIILDGKYNYNKKDKQIKQKIDKFKNQNRNSDYEIIYVIDLDKYRDDNKDITFLIDIKKFVKRNKYKLNRGSNFKLPLFYFSCIFISYFLFLPKFPSHFPN